MKTNFLIVFTFLTALGCMGIVLRNMKPHVCPAPSIEHTCPPPNRLNTQLHFIEVHDPNYRIVNLLGRRGSELWNECDIECQPKYWEKMEEGE